MHKFYEKSLTVDLINNLLLNYWLPTYDSVLHGDYILKDYLYVYLNQVIKCTLSGYIGGKYIQTISNTDPTKLTDSYYNKATFKNIWPYELGGKYRKFTDNYISTSSNYITATHERLGKFVQVYSDITGINLKPYYNCNSNRYTSKIHIARGIDESAEATNEARTKYVLADKNNEDKVLLVPIRFNHTYTIALDCPGAVLMCPIFLSHERRLVLTNPDAKETADKEIDVSNAFLDATGYFKYFPSISFAKPEYVEIECKDTLAETYYKYLKNLYLLILLPKENQSSVVVLEGKYYSNFTEYTEEEIKASGLSINKIKKIPTKIIDLTISATLEDWLLNNSLIGNLSLLQFNTKEHVPYSSCLLEYLYDCVIDYTWKLDTNIERALSILMNNKLKAGIWDSLTRIKSFMYVQETKNSRHLDINGNIDRETERILLKSPYTTGGLF